MVSKIKNKRKCNDCPPDECCNCKNNINSVKGNKKLLKKRTTKRKAK